MRDGIEWEIPQPDNPWANIGYWGDHQIIYLQKLLELSQEFHPGLLDELLTKKIFSTANVPYRIREYGKILENCYDTIVFDHGLNKRIAEELDAFGNDAKLLRDAEGKVIHTNLLGKLLILLLTKLGNFVPEGGIWMNTQRPEWNDANNALAGKGLSVVTLCYLRRFIVFIIKLITQKGKAAERIVETFEVNACVDRFLGSIHNALKKYEAAIDAGFTDSSRRELMDALGRASSEYRTKFYSDGISETTASVSRETLLAFLELSLRFAEQSLRKNRRPDGLYHSYNVLKLGESRASIGRLQEMLEGQVAVLSSGMLTGGEALELLGNLKKSGLYREDQHSYILYPDRILPGFLEKNFIPENEAEKLILLKLMAENGDRSIVRRDVNGTYRFNGTFRNAKDLEEAIAAAAQKKIYAGAAAGERERILELFEEVFHHDEFTGRSGTFFAYEGLGSIYWHMISKLLLAVQENIQGSAENGEPEEIVRVPYGDDTSISGRVSDTISRPRYTAPFRRIRIRIRRRMQGAKQPGMTGQVKEEIIARLGETGLTIRDGRIRFVPRLLRRREFMTQPAVFKYIDVNGRETAMELPAGSIAFTFCQTAFCITLSDRQGMEIELSNGEKRVMDTCELDSALSRRIFSRDGYIRSLRINVQGEAVIKHTS